MKKLSVIFLLMISVSATSAQTSPGFKYAVVDISSAPQYQDSVSRINNSGQIFGTVGSQPYTWDKLNGFQDLSIILGNYTSISAVSRTNKVGGTNGQGQAFIYDLTTNQITNLGNYYVINRISDNGKAAGWSDYYDGGAFVWDNNTFNWIGSILPPSFQAETPTSFRGIKAYDVNSSGQAVGVSVFGYRTETVWRSGPTTVLWSGGAAQDLCPGPGYDCGTAIAINNSGQILYADVFQSSIPGRNARLGSNYIGSFGGENGTNVSDLNNIGEVVGSSETTTYDNHAFLWTQSTGLQDLNDLIPPSSGWILIRASGINDNGEIVGVGLHNGEYRTFALLKNSISGRITDAAGDGISGVAVTLEGSANRLNQKDSKANPQNSLISQTVQTNQSGNFIFTNLSSSLNYTVTPSPTGGTSFSPLNKSFSNVTTHVLADFSAKKPVEIKSYDKRFAPSVERLNFAYNINPTNYTAPFAKLEIFKSSDQNNSIYKDETILKTGSNVSYTQAGTAGWDGKINQGTDAGKYVEPKDGPFTVRISIATQSNYSDAAKDEKAIGVEIESITLNPSGSFSSVKQNTASIETDKPIEAIIKIKNKSGNGVVTALPLMVNWSFEDPDDTASDRIIDPNGGDGNDNIVVAKGGKAPDTINNIAGGVMWKSVTGFTSNIAQDGQTANTIAQTATGANQGKAKINFSTSVIGGDNYYLFAKYQKDDGAVVAEKKSGKWSVRKRLDFQNLYRMDGGADVGSIASNGNIRDSFQGDGYTDYNKGNVTNLTSGANSPEFVAQLLPPLSTELPQPGDTTQQITAKAQAWFDRNRTGINISFANYINRVSAPALSLVGGRYYHPKYDGNSSTGASGDNYPNGTPIVDYYPAGITISVEGRQVDPDGEWANVQGTEIVNVAFIFLNISSQTRTIIVGKHEIGHASDHVSPFGPANDHDTSGLMEPTADQTAKPPDGDPKFSPKSIRKLRGVIEP